MLDTHNTLPGIKGEVFLYFHSKAPLPGTSMWGPFSSPFFVSREYASRCIKKGLNVEIVDPNENRTIIKHRSKQPKN